MVMRNRPQWFKGLKGHIRFKEPLSIHTTLGVGGAATFWAEPSDFRELRKLILNCNKEQIPYLIIGEGSNILFSDQGFRGVVIYLSSSGFTKLEVKGNLVYVGAGLSLTKLINRLGHCGLTGLEFLVGIPASVGGALVMNSGKRTNTIGNLVKSVTIMDEKGNTRILSKRQLRFGYRQSNLNRYIVLEAVLKLIRAESEIIRSNITHFLKEKSRTQDLRAKSAGCIFVNPDRGLTAGEMIEACGLKRIRCGGAEISSKHANYIINRNRATAKDILYLIRLAQRQVKKKFGVLLKPEIKIVDR